MKANKSLTKKLLVSFFAMLTPLLASADPVGIDGIWYNLVSKAKQAEVTKTPNFWKEYSGSITIPATVNYEGVDYSVTSIGEKAFYNCTSLTNISIPESVTSIGKNAFANCSSLTSISIPDSSQLTSVGSLAFYGCSLLTSIIIPEGVTSIGNYTFSTCDRLKSIIIPEGVTSIGTEAFYKCRKLTSITFSDNSQLTNIGDKAFYSCTSLTNISIPESVTSIGHYAFENCSNLIFIRLSRGSQLTSIGVEAFYGCSSLTTITIPEGVKFISSSTFRDCSSLTSITIPKSVRAIGTEAFVNCSELLDVYCYAEELPSTETNIFNGSYPEYATLHVPASALEEYKTTVPWNSFGTIVELGTSITKIALDKTSVTLTEGEALTLTTITTPNDADMNLITWSSSNPNVATVNDQGKVTAVATGTTTITATAINDSSIKASCEVTVEAVCYSATFIIDDVVVATYTLKCGDPIVVPEVPEKEGYTFSGWGDVVDIMPAENVTFKGSYIVNSYTVTFKIGDEVIASDLLEYGATIVAPEAPAKEGYAFSGWGDVAETVPASNLTYEGSYSINSYLLTYTVDGEIVKTDSITYGAAITALAEPTKEGHTFSGWSEVPETMPANDVTISGTFTINKYLVTFKIGDEVIAADSLEYGATIVAPEALAKEGYAFSGWGDVAETVPASNLTYEGSYSINSYLLTYTVDGEIVKTDSITYGAAITALAEPTKEGHTFSGWSEVPETMPANDVTISGTFTINKYLVTFKIGDEVIAADSLEYGTAIVVPETPEKEGYTFNGWGDVAETVPAGDVTYEGSYTVNVYNVYYYVGEELVHTAEVAYGEAIPEYMYEPTEEGCTFLGWVGESYDAMPAHDVTYTANIDNGIDQFIIDNSQLTIYDLTGRRVLNTENLKGGIYIVNGRKVIVK